MSDPTDGWMDAALVAVEEMSATLGFGDYALVERGGHVFDEHSGAYISIAGNVSKVQLGLLTPMQQQIELARLMLDLEEVTDDDREDAFRELANIVAGGVKRNMYEHDSGLMLGLPVYVTGSLDVKRGVRSSVARVRMGDYPMQVVVMCEDNPPAE